MMQKFPYFGRFTVSIQLFGLATQLNSAFHTRFKIARRVLHAQLNLGMKCILPPAGVSKS